MRITRLTILAGATFGLAVFIMATSSASSLPAATPDCGSESTLCLGDRFAVTATWTRPDGATGAGHAVGLTADSGYFWFFDADNLEVAVKGLDGCAIDGHLWIVSAGVTNLAVSLNVTDTASGQTKTYTNAQGVPFQTIVDTTTFSACTQAAALDAGPAEGATTNGSGRGEIVAPRVASEPEPSSGGCTTNDTTLCLAGRFQVAASWQSPSGLSGVGHSTNVTPESGYFWFFDPSNVEVLVKALDACAIGGGKWFFGAGMTTMGVQLTVTDTFTGDVRKYANVPGESQAPGVPFVPILDTGAFSSCQSAPAHVALATHRVRCDLIFGQPPEPKEGFRFEPREIHVHVGDTVTWTGNGDHRIDADDEQWSSPTFSGPFTYRHTFTQAGTFGYRCAVGHWIYGTGGMTASSLCHGPQHYNESGTVVVDP